MAGRAWSTALIASALLWKRTVHGCTTAGDCYEGATAENLAYLTQYGKQLVCDASCLSTAAPDHCNMFGLDQACRGCFTTQADADAYFITFPDQKGDDYVLCPTAAPAPSAIPTAAPSASLDVLVPSPTPSSAVCQTAQDCYDGAAPADIEYLDTFGKALICDLTCLSSAAGTHCNMFGIQQACRGCFKSQADVAAYFAQFPEQEGDGYTLCPTTTPTATPTAAATAPPTALDRVPPTPSPTEAATKTPTAVTTSTPTKASTKAPVVPLTTKPVTTTAGPTTSTPTKAPTKAPVVPITAKPVTTTAAPTVKPVEATSTPTSTPVTKAPTKPNATPSPTAAPVSTGNDNTPAPAAVCVGSSLLEYNDANVVVVKSFTWSGSSDSEAGIVSGGTVEFPGGSSTPYVLSSGELALGGNGGGTIESVTASSVQFADGSEEQWTIGKTATTTAAQDATISATLTDLKSLNTLLCAATGTKVGSNPYLQDSGKDCFELIGTNQLKINDVSSCLSGDSNLYEISADITSYLTDANAASCGDSGCTLDSISTYTFPELSGDTTLVLNIRGTTDIKSLTLNGGWSVTGADTAHDLLINLCDIDTLTLGSVGIVGSILAPYTTVVSTSGGSSFDGQLFADSFTGYTEFHSGYSFTGDVCVLVEEQGV